MEAIGQRTIAGYQHCVRMRQSPDIGSPLIGYIYGMPCPQRCEAVESAIVRALHYIDIVRGYTIRDMRYL
jgi:hypothetical protein